MKDNELDMPANKSNRFIYRDPAFIFLCLIVLLLPVIGPTDGWIGYPFLMRLYFLMAAIPVLLWLIVTRGQLVLALRSPLMLPVWIISLLAVITAFFAADQYDAWLGAVKWCLLLALGVSAYSLIVKRQQGIEYLLLCAAIGGGFMALAVVSQYLFGIEVYLTATEYPWPNGSSGHKNQAASFIVMTLPIAIYFARTCRTALISWIFKLIIALMMAGLVYTLARQSYVALFLELIALVIVFRYVCPDLFRDTCVDLRHARASTLFSCLVFVALIAMPPYYQPIKLENNAVNRLLTKTQEYYQKGVNVDVASKGRLKAWSTTLSMLPDTWYGVGAMNWQVYYPKYNSRSKDAYNLTREFRWRYTHNDYLQTLVEFGVWSIIAGVLLLYGLYKVCRLVLLNGSDREKYQVFSLVIALLGLFVIMLFSFPMSMTIQPAYFCVYLGVLAGTIQRLHGNDSSIVLRSNKVWSPILLFVAVFGGYVAFRMAAACHYALQGDRVYRYIEEHFDKKAMNYENTSAYFSLMAHFVEESGRMDPYHPRLNMMRGGLLAYIAIKNKSSDKKDWYIQKSSEYLNKVRRVFPYYASPDIVDSQLFSALNDTNRQKKSLMNIISLSPGDVIAVKELTMLYIKDDQISSAFDLLEDFFDRFYDYELLNVFAYVAQEAQKQKAALAKISNIELEKFTVPWVDPEEYAKNRQRVDELKYALKAQLNE